MIKAHYVAGFMFDEKDVYLIRKSRPSWQAGKLNGIGGHIEENESPLDALIREFEEESGAKTSPHHWTHIGTFRNPQNIHTSSPWEVWFFRGKIFVGDDIPKTTTDETVERIPRSSFPRADVVPNLNWLIPLALHGGNSWPLNVMEYAQ